MLYCKALIIIIKNNNSLVTQTHSSQASERVWWTPASSLVQPIPRIWGALNVHWLVVNNYTRGDDSRHYVTKPPPSPFKMKFQFLRNTLECMVNIHCRLLTAPKRDTEQVLVHHVRNHVVGDGFVTYGGNRHSLCSYSPPISGHLTLPRFWG